MSAPSTGRTRKSKKSSPNGQLNGRLNGSLNGYPSGHIDKAKVSGPAVPMPRRRRSQRTFVGTLTNIAARIAVWYLIITMAFRCPSSISKVSETSPQICKPYLQARSYVTPYVDPYYQAYVVPQVEKVQPYWDRFDSQLYTPVSTFTKDKYATYGAHRVEQTQHYLEAEWKKAVHPQLLKLQARAMAQYRLHLEPHVNKVTVAAAPYYQQTKDSTLEIYHLTLLPGYEAARPYARQAYTHGHHIITRFVFPYARSARDVSLTFLTRTVWPHVRVLYGDNVEPQLVRIRERLGRRRDQQKIESVVHSLESEKSTISEKETIQTTHTTESTTQSVAHATPSGSGWDILNDIWPSEALSTATEKVKAKTATQPAEPQLTGAELRAKLSEDLRQWQSKFAVAADKGSEDLEQRVSEITERQVENGVQGHGNALLVQLEETADSTISKFKQIIKQTVESVPEDATEEDLETAYERCIAKTRELGLAVKDRAQAVRAWKASYDQETDTLVKAAVRSTVEVLERVHALGLQEVGMRWAWTDGVTYKDWQKYHKVRNTLTEWQAEVEAVGSRHEGLKIAHDEAKALEDKAMATAANMVAELVRLKDVSKWKIWAGDATDDFSDRKVPARVFRAATNIASNVENAASKASNTIIGSETPKSESVASAVKDKVASASSQASSLVGSVNSPLASGSSVVKEQMAAASSQASSLVGSVSPPMESAASVVQEKAADASKAAAAVGADAKSSISAATDNVKSKIQEGKDKVQEAASAASPAPKKQKKVLGGVMADAVPKQHDIIYDDEDTETYSRKIQDMVAGAEDRAADLSRAVSEALLGAPKTQGSVESVSSLASEQYGSAIAAASRVLYGTEQQPIESMTSVASDKFAEAVTAASYAIYGTPTPTAIFKTVHVKASSSYNQAVSLANEQFSNAKSQLSLLVSGTPKPAHETMMSLIEQAYSDSLAAASDRLQLALHYTDSVKSYAAGPTQGYLESVSSVASAKLAGPTQGYFESVSSIAASKLSEGLSLASAQFTSQPTPAMDGARKQYYEAVGLAHARYQEFLDSASTAVYGPQQGTVQSIASDMSASAQSAASKVSGAAESLASQVSSGVIGSETPWTESVASDISASAQSAASKVSGAAESLASQASSGVIGSETPWTESVASQASLNWEALISKASTQVYGQPTPWSGSVYSQVGAYGAQATAQAVAQYAAVQALISELVVGKEPDFTESVMDRFSSAYYTGIPAAVSSVSSYASENYESASSIASENIEAVSSMASENIEAVTSYAGETFDSATSVAAEAYESASSVVSSIFTPPPAIETVLSQASEQINMAVESASSAIYGTSKGNVEQATDSMASAYSVVQSKASEAIYGTQQAQNSFSAVASSAQAAISEAIWGAPTPTGYVAAATDGAGSVINSISSVAAENAAYAAGTVSSAIYGPEQGAVESASSRIAAAVEAANSRIAEMYASAAENAQEAASTVASVVTQATQNVKDEL